MTWHADTDTIVAYARGEIDDARAFSLEAHLLACPVCRDTCARATSDERLAAVWSDVVDTLDRPRQRIAERALRRIGIRDHLARLIGATPSLQLSWLLAVGVTLAFAVMAAFASRSPAGAEPLVFLLVAPLIPLAGVATAFGPGIDPTYEMGLAAPMSGFRVMLVRALAVLTTSLTLTGAAALTLPGPGWAAAAWLLPALALSLAALALSTAFPPITAAGGLAAIWLAAVVTIERVSETPLASFQTGGQVAFLALTLLGALILAIRRDAFERERKG